MYFSDWNEFIEAVQLLLRESTCQARVLSTIDNAERAIKIKVTDNIQCLQFKLDTSQTGVARLIDFNNRFARLKEEDEMATD